MRRVDFVARLAGAQRGASPLDTGRRQHLADVDQVVG
jgi:hypothetical protein